MSETTETTALLVPNGDTTSSEHEHQALSSAKVQILLGSMMVGSFLAAMDATIITTLSTVIANEFNELTKISWISTSYLISNATFQPLYGKLSDIFGRRPLLLFVNLVFCLGCAMSFFANSLTVLIVSRFITGIGGGGLTSLCSITLSDLVPLQKRGIYQGLMNIGFACGTASGGVIGGFFAVKPVLYGWRGAFLFQVPLSMVSFALVYCILKLPAKPGAVGTTTVRAKLQLIDWYGALSLTVFLILFLTITSLVGDDKIAINSFRSAAAYSIPLLASLALFVKIENGVSNPILPIRFLKNPSVLGASLANFFTCVSQFIIFYYLPIYFSAVLNLDSNQIGHRYVFNFFSTVVGSLGSGIYMRKTGRYFHLLIFGGIVLVIGILRVVLITPAISRWEQFTLLPISGFGASILITATLLALIASVPHEHQAATTSISYLFRSCGCALGVSIGSVIFTKLLEINLNAKVMRFLSDQHPRDELLSIIESARHNSNYIHDGGAPSFIRQTLVDCYSSSTRLTYLFGFAVSVLNLATLFLIKEYKLHSTISRSDK